LKGLREVGMIKTARDVLLFKISKRTIMVVSCDSAGGIGSKQHDVVKVDPKTIGRFTARVALMEALSVGATPLCLSNTLPVEPQRTGKEIVRGIRGELKDSGLNPGIPMVQSTEKNIRVSQTGVGVTVIGLADKESLKIRRCKAGDAVVAIGLPQVGAEVITGERRRRIADTRDVRRLLDQPFVHEVIPVGSQGILHEARTVASDSNLEFKLRRDLKIDVAKSAGPGTTILCVLAQEDAEKLSEIFPKPVNPIGALA